jgi:phosphoribosylaminoimidazole-succinocarboxamide synthase
MAVKDGTAQTDTCDEVGKALSGSIAMNDEIDTNDSVRMLHVARDGGMYGRIKGDASQLTKGSRPL